MSQIFLVRHGEPTLRGVLLGGGDPCLSGQGHRQSHEVAERVKALPLARAVYSSSQRRAMQTASYLLNPWVPLTVLRGLAEISYGPWDGLTWIEIEKRDPELSRLKSADWMGVNIPGAEPWDAFARRVDRAFETIRSGPLPAIVVAHQAVNAQIAHLLTGCLQTDFHQKYCEVLSYASHRD